MIENWSQHRDSLRKRFYAFGSGPDVMISNVAGSVIISHAQFEPFAGTGSAMPYTVLGLCTEGGGRTRRETDKTCFDDTWKPGKVGLMLPGPPSQGFSPRMKTLGIAFDLSDVPVCHGEKITTDDLQMAAGRLIEDELVSAVMIALLRNAEAHGAASAFFDHGLSLILHRLVSRAKSELRQPRYKSHSKGRLNAIFDLIEDSLGDDLRVKEMAHQAGLEPRSFTRNFKLETGYTPYQYLTRRRMERAKQLLKSGESVTDTATSVGYTNPAKFSAAFRRWIGETPSSWRRGC